MPDMEILEEVDTAHGTIRIIHDHADDTITYVQDGILQSQCDRQGDSTCGYILAMAQLLAQTSPRNMLMIGGAGGCLARLLHKSGCHVTIVDTNSYAFTLARRYFHLPDTIECVEADGAEFLLNDVRSYDAIAIDAYNNKGQIPRSLLSPTFFRILNDALTTQGLALMNIMTAHDLDMLPDRIAHKAKASMRDLILFDRIGKKERNTLLAIGNVQHLEAPIPLGPATAKEEMRGLIRRLPRV